MNRVHHATHLRSVHMTDVKGKGICYEKDDEPIQLTDQDDSPTIRDYRLSLIGKILNPKKQSVEKLIQTMPVQWEMQDKITANDLGNGKFFLNFATEEDLLSVLRQGPFQVKITGIPLYLWTIKNLRNIGNRLGYVDTLELEAGRMLIDVDSRKPLTFTRKIASPEGDEVSIQIHYEKLFKFCKTCGLITHEMAYCPTKESNLRSQVERSGVFARVQLPMADVSRQPSLRQQQPHDSFNNHGHTRNMRRSRSPTRERCYDGGFMIDARAAHHRYDEHNERFPGKHGRHDRKIRSTFTRQSSRYAPYEKKKQHSWRIKDHSKTREDVNMKIIAPYVSIPRTGDIGGSSTQQSDGVMMQDTQQSSGKRIASLIVTPSRHALDDNVTKRPTVSPRLLTFSPTEEVLPVDAQVISALNDMEITSNSAERLNDADKSEGGNEDDLLGEDLMDMKADIVKLTERDAGNDKGRVPPSRFSKASQIII
ncbi:hypothetical protein DY000_02020715 [Brassica cretica]|uniref:Zinc knuckle CX2CX4HX4C domain-containing protein n=1 Tax=Brassica cretica TaxID=69181 RepID=A0ABQ7E959_BRACR|nr:hypothetical protein DY000_02020715 [Brassica cretica]